MPVQVVDGKYNIKEQVNVEMVIACSSLLFSNECIPSYLCSIIITVRNIIKEHNKSKPTP